MASTWKPNAQVNNAWNTYVSGRNDRPGAYVSNWQEQLDTLYGQIENRPDFAYDMNGDAMYQQYKDRFTQQGQQAGQGAMGMASARTGGFNSSVAQTASQQAYQGYMNQLSGTIPGLENQAYGRYQDQGQALLNLYGITQQNEQNAYGQYRDQVGDWQTDRDFNYGLYADQRDFNYGRWNDNRIYNLNR